jgi:AbrB family looped-hinge helix DNA binding protein
MTHAKVTEGKEIWKRRTGMDAGLIKSRIFVRLTYIVSRVTLLSMSATESVTFTTKGQVVIPARLRRQFEIKEGTQATVIATPEGILLKPITRAFIRSLRGKYAHLPIGTKELEAERRRDRIREDEERRS